MNESKLTSEQAYLAMFSFLEAYYKRGNSDEIGGMLGSMSLLEDGRTADPAIEADWNEAVSKVLRGETNANLKLSK